MSLTLRFATRSDVGLVRKSNQDSGYAGPHLLVLADGMGGPAGGDIASSIAVAHLADLDTDAHGADDLLNLLRTRISDAHEELVDRSSHDADLHGLGTTCIAVLRSGNKLAMTHIGDSRAYLLRQGTLTQVTTDHSFVQYLVQSGQLTPEQAETHPQRSVLLRVLGDSTSDITLDESIREAVEGDRWLLCSDGLSGVVSAQTIGEVLHGVEDPADACDQLIALALRAGGPDNVTVVIADVVDPDHLGFEPSASPQIVGAAATNRLDRTRDADSAAGKAAALTGRGDPSRSPRDQKEVEADEADARASKRKKRRSRLLTAAISLLIAAAVGVGGILAWNWSQSQYYVAPYRGTVAIYQGIPQTIGPWHLSHHVELSNLRMSELDPFARDRLNTPITRESLTRAREVVKNLQKTHVRNQEQSSNSKPPKANK